MSKILCSMTGEIGLQWQQKPLHSIYIDLCHETGTSPLSGSSLYHRNKVLSLPSFLLQVSPSVTGCCGQQHK